MINMTDERMLKIATKLFPRWREDIQAKFVTELGRAILEAEEAAQERAASLTDTERIAASIGLGVFPEKVIDEQTREWLQAKPNKERAASPDWQARAMFVARLKAVPKDQLVSPNWVLNLLNDCDMLAGTQERATSPFCPQCGFDKPLVERRLQITCYRCKEVFLSEDNSSEPEMLCTCGSPMTLGVVHRRDGPCWVPDAASNTISSKLLK